MTPDQKALIGTAIFNSVVTIIPALSLFVVGILGWLLNEVKATRIHVDGLSAKANETAAKGNETAQKVYDLSNGVGVEKIVSVITNQQAEGKLPPGPVAQDIHTVPDPAKMPVVAPNPPVQPL